MEEIKMCRGIGNSDEYEGVTLREALDWCERNLNSSCNFYTFTNINKEERYCYSTDSKNFCVLLRDFLKGDIHSFVISSRNYDLKDGYPLYLKYLMFEHQITESEARELLSLFRDSGVEDVVANLRGYVLKETRIFYSENNILKEALRDNIIVTRGLYTQKDNIKLPRCLFSLSREAIRNLSKLPLNSIRTLGKLVRDENRKLLLLYRIVM